MATCVHGGRTISLTCADVTSVSDLDRPTFLWQRIGDYNLGAKIQFVKN